MENFQPAFNPSETAPGKREEEMIWDALWQVKTYLIFSQCVRCYLYACNFGPWGNIGSYNNNNNKKEMNQRNKGHLLGAN